MVQFFFSEPADFYLQWREGCCGHQAVQEFEHPNSNCSFWGTFRTWVKYRAAWMDLITSDKGDTAGNKASARAPRNQNVACMLQNGSIFKLSLATAAVSGPQFVLSSCWLTWTAATSHPEGALSFWAGWSFLLHRSNEACTLCARSAIILSRAEFCFGGSNEACTLGVAEFQHSGICANSLKDCWAFLSHVATSAALWDGRFPPPTRGVLQCSHYCMISLDSCEERNDGNISQTIFFMFGQLRTSSPCLSFNFASGFNWPPFLSGAF